MTVSPSSNGFRPGTEVEVRNRFDGSWAPGFAISEMGSDGYKILRLRDLTLLPLCFGPDEVRVLDGA